MKFRCHTINHLLRLLVVAVISTVSTNVFADAATELAKKTQSPVSDLIVCRLRTMQISMLARMTRCSMC